MRETIASEKSKATDTNDLEQFSLEAHRAVDWMTHYLGNSENYPVLSRVAPGSIAEELPLEAPPEGLGLRGMLDEFERIVLPGITHWNSPQFMAYFAITGSPPGVLAEMLTAALNVNGMLWETSPAATEIEQVVLGWLAQMLGLPDGLFGIVYDTASISTLCAVAAARQAALPEVRTKGLTSLPQLRLYTSQEAHSVVEKAAIVLGIGQDNVRKIAVDDHFRLEVGQLREAIAEDRRNGFLPFCVVATVGTTSTTSVDPVAVIADICELEGLWLHVDAAYAGSRGSASRASLGARRMRKSGLHNRESPQVAIRAPRLFGVLYAQTGNAEERLQSSADVFGDGAR